MSSSQYGQLLQAAAERLFSAEDTVCLERARLVTEADQLYAADPLPVRRAKCLRHILERMTLDLESNPLIAGNTSSAPRAWMLVPEFGLEVNAQISLEHDILPREFLAGRVPQEIIDYWKPRAVGNTPGGCAGIGHMSIDFDLVVNRGLQSVIDQCRQRAAEGDESQQQYRRAMIIACEAVIGWARRYAAEAERLAAATTDALLAECYGRIAAACRQVPQWPARDYFEGLQAMLLAHLATVIEGQGLSQSVGLPDRVLKRFADEVAADTERAAELTGAFLLGMASNSYQGRGSKTQAITVGGSDAAGNDACNAVTQAFLAAFDRTPVNDPHLFVRWHRNLAPQIMAEASRMLASGRSMPMLVNDHAAATALADCGIAAEDAWDYCICGCNEIGIPGRCTVTAFSLGASLVDVAILHEAIENQPAAGTAAELLAAYEAAVEKLLVEAAPVRQKKLEQLAAAAPMPLTSACCRGSAEAGADYLLAMPYRKLMTLFARGTVNAINALAAIDDIVSRRKLSPSPAALLQRWRGGDAEVGRWIAQAPKWGQDDDRADAWAVALHAARRRAIEAAEQRLGMPILICHVIRSLHHLTGRGVDATLDGRRKGEPLAASVGVQQGSGREVPTAMLASVLKLDGRRDYRGIYNLNLTLPTGETSPQVVQSLCETFFRGGGQELQVGVLDVAQLRAAQKDPRTHRDLVVRIAGLNARFVELSAMEQEEVIQRAQ